MYDYIKGTLTRAQASTVTLETQGIGYKIATPHNALAALPELNETATLWLSFVIRENSQALYGFPTEAERDVFEVLLGISGVGPKMALALIGHLTFEELQTAIADHDVKTICKVPGVGKKTAERLLIEIRDKLPQHLNVRIPHSRRESKDDLLLRDALSALINLGYNQMEARKAVQRTLEESEDTPPLGVLITKSLQKI